MTKTEPSPISAAQLIAVVEFGIGRQPLTGYAVRENQAHAGKTAEDAEKAGLLTDTRERGSVSSEPSSSHYQREGELAFTAVAGVGVRAMAQFIPNRCHTPSLPFLSA